MILTRRGRAVAAIVEAKQLERLRADSDELADIRAVDAAWVDAEELRETSIPWADVKRHLGLTFGAAQPSRAGHRQLLGTRPPAPLAAAARKRADKLGMTVSDYLITLLARDLNLPEFAPKPADAGMVDDTFSG